jgi:DNA repair exonuclease SbcCD ATPase subunit
VILFKTIKYKNFLSSGNKFTEVDLNHSKHTLIVGHNGAGKSTMLDALSFALFGKAHRNINKPQLVNSINKKDCLVEVEFQIGKKSYKIRRGISPGIFEIYVNKKLLNQSSNNREYQRILEQNILKLNHKSFHQVVVLGSSSFIPFMQLPQGHRRSVIEDLLDINVFSKMNQLLKEQNSKLKDEIKNTSHQIEINQTKKNAQKKYITDLSNLNTSHKQEKENQIKDLSNQVKNWQKENEKLVNEINSKKPRVESELQSNQSQKQTMIAASGEIMSQIKAVIKEARFFEENDTCPTCRQEIDDDTKDTAMAAAKEKARHLASRKDGVERKTKEVEETLNVLNTEFNEINQLQNKINTNITSIQQAQKTISRLEKELNKLINGTGDLKEAKNDMNSIEIEREDLVDKKFKLTDQFQYNNVMSEMLKDTGIKTKIIKQYLPVINKLVNQYLQILDFFVSFELDDAFGENIRSRHRDIFSYDSFSEGEKQRIDLALLFTWRQVAKMKNSVATNLLILDETFDSSLDHDGVENLMKILYTLSDDTNVFVISHKGEILEGKFEKKIEFKKIKNFSVMI